MLLFVVLHGLNLTLEKTNVACGECRSPTELSNSDGGNADLIEMQLLYSQLKAGDALRHGMHDSVCMARYAWLTYLRVLLSTSTYSHACS